ncbi:MAG: pentapeptide repeat-containing protein [Pseudomonadota bacterium]
MAGLTVDLNILLQEHALWVSSAGAQGNKLALDNLDFRGYDLTGANLVDAELPGACFAGMALTGVDFHGAFLGGADFSDAKLRNVTLSKAHLDCATFANAMIDGGTWFRSSCFDANLKGARFTGTDLEHVSPSIDELL